MRASLAGGIYVYLDLEKRKEVGYTEQANHIFASRRFLAETNFHISGELERFDFAPENFNEESSKEQKEDLLQLRFPIPRNKKPLAKRIAMMMSADLAGCWLD